MGSRLRRAEPRKSALRFNNATLMLLYIPHKETPEAIHVRTPAYTVSTGLLERLFLILNQMVFLHLPPQGRSINIKRAGGKPPVSFIRFRTSWIIFFSDPSISSLNEV